MAWLVIRWLASEEVVLFGVFIPTWMTARGAERPLEALRPGAGGGESAEGRESERGTEKDRESKGRESPEGECLVGEKVWMAVGGGGESLEGERCRCAVTLWGQFTVTGWAVCLSLGGCVTCSSPSTASPADCGVGIACLSFIRPAGSSN